MSRFFHSLTLATIKKKKKMKSNIKEEITNTLKKGEINEAVDLLLEFQEKNDTVYYKDIIALKGIAQIFATKKNQGVLHSSEERDIAEYIRMNLYSLCDELAKEQEFLLEENLRFIKKEIEQLKQLLVENKSDDFTIGLNRLFLKIHSRHYKEFLKIISADYDPRTEGVDEYKNLRFKNLFDLVLKIQFEKELIHKEILHNELLKHPTVKKIISHIKNGQIQETLNELENISTSLITSFNKKNVVFNKGEIDYKIRKPFELNCRCFEIMNGLMQGVMTNKNYIIENRKIIDEIFEYIEFAYRNNTPFLLTGKLTETQKVDKDIKEEVRHLISNNKIIDAIDLMTDNIGEERKSFLNELVLHKSTFNNYRKKEMLGISEDTITPIKISNALLNMLDEI